MSLVVLRSWGEGQPPKVRAIAPPDSDKDEVIVPDNKGRFVTKEVVTGKGVSVGPKPGQAKTAKPVAQPRSSVLPPLVNASSSSVSSTPSPPVPELRTKSWNDYGLQSDKAQTLPHDFRKVGQLPLSRESSVNSATTDSPPSSPVCGSRYKNLGADLAATIPRRQIIRETWVKEGHTQFKKQTNELSKSTPDLLSHDHDLAKDEASVTELPPVVSRRNGPVNDVTARPRPLSYIDIFYGSDGEPQFGDRPASVVQVFKKDPTINQNWSQSERNLRNIPEKPLDSSDNLKGSSKVIKKYKAGRSFSTEFRREPILAQRPLVEQKQSLPTTLPEVSKPIFRTELKLPHVSSATIEYLPVRTVIQKPSTPERNDPNQPVRPESEIIETKFEQIETLVEITRHDENEEIDYELEALRDESNRSTASTLEVETVQTNSRQEIIIPIRSDSDMSTTCSSSTTSSPQFFFKDTRRSTDFNLLYANPKEMTTKVNGSTWAQVPVQCVNRHVFLPQEAFSSPTPEPERKKNGKVGHGGGQLKNTNYKENQERRKNFCDELLNDVVIQVPPSIRPKIPPPPPTTPPPPRGGHDGIIIFDEEEEDINLDDTETGSHASTSEREKSVDYISVFHNVQVSSSNSDYSKLGHKTTIPEIVRIVGLDLGSLTTRYATLEIATGTMQIGPVQRSLTTADGVEHGAEAISHAMFTKSKLIYKWKRKQSFPYDPYDSEGCSTTLETLLRTYRYLLTPSKRGKESQEPESHLPPTQWNLTIHGGMDKKLVRESALSSGLVKSIDELRLVNESTAAAVTACGFLQRQIPAHVWGKTFLSVNIGSTFIHTSGFELRGRKLLRIESSDSQAYESPETNFIELFSRIFGRDFILKFESSFQPSWIEILTRFDEMKELFCKSQAEGYLFLPLSFYLEFKKFSGMEISECVEDNVEEGIRWDRNGAIHFNRDLLTDWLQPIVNFIKTRLKIRTYDSLVLSGGGTNNIIATEMKRILPFVNIYNLPDADAAVVEGLVRLDSTHVIINCPFSIGVGVMTPFDETSHPSEKAVVRQGKKWCSDVWDTLIRKGQQLTIGQTVLKRSYVGAQPGQNVLVLPIFKSELEDPKLVTSPSVEKCCELRFEINEDKVWREVELIIKCNDSELSIVATGNDGEVNRVVIDF